MLKKILCIGAIGMATLLAKGEDFTYSYQQPGDAPAWFGTNKPDSYDVAIKIADPLFVGTTVKSIRVELPTATATDLSAWVSSELKLDNKVNVPDVTASATVADGILTAVFAEAPEITADGLFVGYSFTTTDRGGQNDAPVAVVESHENSDCGLWIHTKKGYTKWTNIAETKGFVSAMTVTLGTNFGDYELAVRLSGDSYAANSPHNTVTATVVNLGAKGVASIEYTYIIGESRASGSYQFGETLPKGASVAVNLPIEVTVPEGDYAFSLSIDKCDGVANANAHRQAASTMHVWPFVPVKRVMVEEYTGLNCGYCPEGYVIMEEMHKKYGDRMVGAAFHTKVFESGAMVTVDNADFPNAPDGYPYAFINRASGMEISKLPNALASQFAGVVPVGIEVALADNDGKASSEITVSFATAANGNDYRLEAILVADGLHNSSWRQTNYFSGKSDPESIDSDLWEIFLNGGKQVAGLNFNDVVVYYTDDTRRIDCFPAEIASGDAVKHCIEIPYDAIRNVRKQEVLCDGCTLRLVALVIDSQSGEAVNCNISNPLQFTASGIEALPSDSEIVATTYATIDGVCVARPSASGVYLRTDHYKDGTRRTTKIIITK